MGAAMGIFNKFSKETSVEINQHGKKFSSECVIFSVQQFISDSDNPAMEYLSSNYGIQPKKFSYFSDQFIDCAKANAEIFSEETGFKANDHLVHFFFDLYIALNSALFSDNNDIASACIDAMHIRYFGPPSHDTITSILELGLEREKCYLSSILALSKTEPGDFFSMIASFAKKCVSSDVIGATEALALSRLLLKMLKHFKPTNDEMLNSR